MFKSSKAAIVALVALVLVLSLVVGCAQLPIAGSTAQPSSTSTSQSANKSGAQNSASDEPLVKLYDAVSPGVVLIENDMATSQVGLPLDDNSQPEGAGAGFVIDTSGLILTNNHVVENSKRLIVTLLDGSQYDAKVLGSDAGNDVALIKIDAPADQLHPLTLGDSDQIKIGQSVIAIGNPFGYERTMTTGIVSSIDRTLASSAASGRPMRSLIQTDASINPGNSGGVLLNTQGEVVGITTAIESPVRGSVGVGFAVPINSAKNIMEALKAGTPIEHAWLGISGWAVNPQLNQKLSLGVDKGTYVLSVVNNGPAAKAGIKGSDTNTSQLTGLIDSFKSGGDVVTAIDGKAMSSIEQVAAYVDTKKPGDVVKVTVMRDKAEKTIDVTLEKWPETVSAQQSTPNQPVPGQQAPGQRTPGQRTPAQPTPSR